MFQFVPVCVLVSLVHVKLYLLTSFVMFFIIVVIINIIVVCIAFRITFAMFGLSGNTPEIIRARILNLRHTLGTKLYLINS